MKPASESRRTGIRGSRRGHDKLAMHDERPMFRVPPSLAGPKTVFLSCHYCGYGAAAVPDDGVCPKCKGHSWERWAVSSRLLPPKSPPPAPVEQEALSDCVDWAAET